ncbi:MAG: glycogen-debranching protein [Candidatus Accumulibacter sp.]|uniref:Glycogen-debranching protein n=1 Tax=Candidatus Accumulibacter affinis TaxID=2954384 RepID=A0A935T9F8_9PROT|nr:glycogen-debranching protein [Candidatus Accumulibacter affinis]MBP9804854.1 glycogen-debranching protein [Accumulibacter sp.]
MHPVRNLLGAALACVALSPPPAAAAINASQLGANYNANHSKINFKVYSSRATRIELWLYASASGTSEVVRIPLTRGDGNVWSTSVSRASLTGAGINGPVYYGYRAWGPNWTYDAGWSKGSSLGFVSDVDAQGNRFNPNKLLIDPYARELSHDPLTPTNLDGTTYASGPLHRTKDSGHVAPKGIVVSGDRQSVGTRPTRAFKDDVVYEVHVRGFTMNDNSIPAAYRGTYRGAGMKAAYLKSLGVTAVEFLPVQETQNDTNDVLPESTADDNYWGYSTLNYFSPDRRYAADRSAGGPTREFKAMVKALHDQGIKVMIDVVYNHTGEGGSWSSTDNTTYNVLSFRGLDNPTYYTLTSDLQHTWDNTGVGGNYNTHNPIAQNLIVDSLAYWRDTLGIDGFRFDLAPVLGNTCEVGCFNFDKMDSGNALNRIVRELPPRPAGGGAGVDLVAEPWAIGGNSYQIGGFPSGWSEWNGSYRDNVRQSQNKLGAAPITTGQLATRFAGSADLYENNGRKPWNSVNLMVAHDGFTLRDLYACNAKNNGQAWPYGPSDGGEDNNNSWDQAGVAADQRKAARNGLALMLLSAGVPMLTGGDESLRSLQCNNNPYNLDSSANWLSWSWDTDQNNFQAFARGLINFRRNHPALRPVGFYSSIDNNGNVMEQLRWFKPDGSVADSAYFSDPESHAIAWRIDGSELGDSAAAIYVAYNAWSGDVNFTLPWPGSHRKWHRVTDTCTWAEGANQVRAPGSEDFVGVEGSNYGVCGRGVVLLIAR